MALILASTAGSEVYTSFEDIGLATVIIAETEQFQGSKNLTAIRNELSLKGSSQMRPKRSDMNKSQFLYSFHTQRSPTTFMKFLNAFNRGFLHRRNSSAVFSRTSGFDKSQNKSNASETLGIGVLAPPNTAGASVDLACGFFGWTSFVR